MDIYYPPDYQFKAKLPVVIIVRGFTDLGSHSKWSDKDFQQAIDWAKLFAASGMIAVAPQAFVKPDETLNHALDYLISNADQLGIDATRIGFWGCGAQGWPANSIFPDSPYRDNFRAAAFIYSDLKIIPASWPKNLSLFVVKSGKDEYISGPVIDKYVDAARANNIPVEYIVLPDAVDGFELLQDAQFSKDTVQKILEFFKSKLLTAK
jgi:acetyl esterase/lipase